MGVCPEKLTCGKRKMNKNENKNEKNNEKKFANLKKYKVTLIFAGIAMVCASICTVCVVKILSKPVIGFYGIDPATQNAICTVIENWSGEKNGSKFKFKTLDSAKTLESQLFLGTKPELLFTTSGSSVKIAAHSASKNAALTSELLAKMASSFRGAAISGKKNGTVAALPLVCGHFEISVNTTAFRNSGMKAIATWDDIEKFLKIQKKSLSNPLIFAGKDPEVFLDLLGALTEALDGAEEYEKACALIEEAKEKKWKASALAEELCGSYNAPLYTAAKKLSEWFTQGLLSRDCFNLTGKDVNAFLKAKLSSVVFMPLYAHRTVEQDAIKRFSTIYFPSERSPGTRKFTGEIIYGVPQKKNSLNSRLALYLASEAGQEELSRATGLAPVFAQCRTPDRQADDVRYWIAATNTPLAGLSRESDLTQKQKTELAQELAAKIKTGNFQ